MSSKTEYVILPETNEFVRRSITEEKLDIEKSLIDDLGNQIIRQSKQIFKLPDEAYPGFGAVNLSLSNEGAYWTVPIKKLPLKTHYAMRDGVLSPVFAGKDEPVMPLEWVPPEGMRLALIVFTKKSSEHRFAEQQWLFAFDTTGHVFRLPTGNCYDDGKLCSGDFERRRQSDYDCIKAEVDQLITGQWQGDLDRAPDSTRQMFRFKPLNDGFEQLPPTVAWPSLCMKIAPAIQKFTVL